MAAKGHLRFWLVAVTALVCLTALWNSNFFSSAPTIHRIVKHHSKRELVEVPNNETEELRVHTNFMESEHPDPFFELEVLSDQPSAKCPIADPSMDPCRCRSLARGIVVECRDVEDRSQLTNALAGLQNYVISEAKLTDIDFEIENEDLDRTKFLQLHFLRGVVRIRGEADTFSFAHNAQTKTALKAVLFVGCKIDLGNTTLSRAPSVLSALEFHQAEFSAPYRYEWFDGLQVEQLRIHDSKSIKAPIALLLVGLQSYEHTKCELKEISGEFLPRDKSSLTRLDFSMNSLTSLPQDIFDGIPKLEEVLLGSNHFTALDENVFASVWSYMQKLDVKGNFQLQCNGMDWLRMKTPEERAKVKGTCIDDSGVEIDLQLLL